jgi:HPt (histidine-containing phosphotransfer) domain-containing protein
MLNMRSLSIITVLSFILLLLASPAAAVVQGKGGVADFASIRWDAVHNITGEWRFFPNRFLKGEDIQAEDFSLEQGLLVKVPAGINDYRDAEGRPLDHKTWGTFVLEITNLRPPFEDIGLNVRGDTAYEVFVMDLERPTPIQRILSVGQVGTSPETSIPQVASPVGFWRADGSGHYLLIIHLSGFHYPWGGLWTSPQISSYKILSNKLQLIFLCESLVAGMILVMSLYHLSLYLHRNEDRASLVLSIFSGSVLLRFLGSSPSIINVLFPEPSLIVFEVVRKFEFATLGIMGACGAWFAMATFNLQAIRPFLRLQTHVGIAACVFCLLTPATLYPRFVIPLDLILLFHVASYLAIVAWAVMRKVTGGLYLAVGGVVIASAVFHDVLIGTGILDSPIFLAPFGMIFLLFCNGQVVADLFASSFRTAQRLSLTLQEEVERKTRKIRTMLDHIPQGVMGIVAPAVADDEHSRHLKLILETEHVAGASLNDILLHRSLLSSDEKSRVMAALDAILNEDFINFEFNAPQLVTELVLVMGERRKYLQLDWAPIVNNLGIVEKLQLTLHDFTRIRVAEEQSEKQRQQLVYIQEMLAVPSTAFAVFVPAAESLLSENERILTDSSESREERLKHLYINIHTLKGSARTLGLTRLSALAHDVEQLYAELQKDPESSWPATRLHAEHEKLKDLLAQYQHIYGTVLGRQGMRDEKVGLSREFLEKLSALLHSLAPLVTAQQQTAMLQEAVHTIEMQVFQDVSHFFPEMRTALRNIARDLKREEPHLMIDADGFLLSRDGEALLRKVMIHILRNALDHGIEDAAERLQKGKAPAGTLALVCREEAGAMMISISDDGRGLPLALLRARATQYGMAANLQAEELAQLIFESGLSTAARITEISGRGMGMDAVRRYLREAGGDATLELISPESHPEFCPFRLIIHLPERYYRRDERAHSTPSALVS